MKHAAISINEHGVLPSQILEDPLGRFHIGFWDHPAGFEFTANVEHDTDTTIKHPRGTATLGGSMQFTWPDGTVEDTARGWCSPDYIPVGHYNFLVGPGGHQHVCFRWPDDNTFQTRTAHRIQTEKLLPIRVGTGAREFVVVDGTVTVKGQTFEANSMFSARMDRSVLLNATDAVVIEIVI